MQALAGKRGAVSGAFQEIGKVVAVAWTRQWASVTASFQSNQKRDATAQIVREIEVQFDFECFCCSLAVEGIVI
jgi:hypothetical protein